MLLRLQKDRFLKRIDEQMNHYSDDPESIMWPRLYYLREEAEKATSITSINLLNSRLSEIIQKQEAENGNKNSMD